MSEIPSPIGARIGRYETIRLIGQGGMGRVLLARDSVLGRLVAVKILRDDLGIPPEMRDELFARMRQEARAVAAVSHPNLVTLYDMGDEAPVGLFLVFEYVDGPTLRERITDHAVTISEVATMARELGDALTVAHDAGVIHRDIKPENVLLASRGAKVTDFGVARLPDSALTRAGTLLGTPAYNAPEALLRGQFSPLSDQFSLATTLYEAITGVRAFEGEDALTVATRIGTVTPASFTEAAPHIVGLREAERVIARGMAKRPSDRYATCRDFGEALSQALFRSVQARSWGVAQGDTIAPGSLVPRSTRRTHNVIAAIALVVIVVLFMLGRKARNDIADGADAGAPIRRGRTTRTTNDKARATTRAVVPAAGAEESEDGGADNESDGG